MATHTKRSLFSVLSSSMKPANESKKNVLSLLVDVSHIGLQMTYSPLAVIQTQSTSDKMNLRFSFVVYKDKQKSIKWES